MCDSARVGRQSAQRCAVELAPVGRPSCLTLLRLGTVTPHNSSLTIFWNASELFKYTTSGGEAWRAVLDLEKVWGCGLSLLPLQSLD